MKLPIPSFGKKENKEYFLCLLLREEKVTAVVLEEVRGVIKIVGKREEHLKGSIEDATVEEWIETFDKAISTAETALPPTVESHKTLFGVKESWVEIGKIKKDYLIKLKKVSDALDLEPIGFLVLTEAISHFLHKHEGAPISAVFVEVGQKKLSISLVKAGKIVETRTSEIEVSAATTTDSMLKHFETAQVLPSRIILSQEDRDEKMVQEFIAHSWSKSLPFLHMPQITALPESFDVKAVVFGAASQMGFEVLQEPTVHTEETELEGKNAEELKTTEETDEDFGFYEDKDVALEKKPKKVHIEEENLEEAPATIKINSHEKHVGKDDARAYYSDDLQLPTEEPKKASARNPLQAFSQFFMIFSKNKPSLPMRGKFMIIPPILLVLCILLFFLYTQMLKATITISVEPEVINETQDITISKDSNNNFSEHIVGGEVISAAQQGSASTQATGKKETGEKAKGTVTLFSRLAQSKTFPAGTTIKSSNSIEFTFDKEVSVASSSADASASPSTAKVAVTASEIGKEANLPSGTKFTVGNSNAEDLVAKNDSAMSGGSKKEITVVDRSDLDTLDEKLPKDLKEKAQADIAKKVSGDSILIPEMVSTKLSKKDYDKKVGDEAKTVKLDGTVTFEALTYTKEDLTAYAKELIKDRVSEDQSTSDSGIDFSLDKVKVEEGEAKGTLKIKAHLLPKLDKEKVTQAIAGKSFENAEKVITNLPQVSKSSVQLSPNLPFLPKILPQKAQNITVVIKNNE